VRAKKRAGFWKIRDEATHLPTGRLIRLVHRLVIAANAEVQLESQVM